MQAWWYFRSLDTLSLVSLFWYMLVFEVPRYSLATIVVAFDAMWRRAPPPIFRQPSVSILLVGHNEAHALRRCVLALAEQSVMRVRSHVQIVVVDDGSVDGMSRIARKLRAEGMIDDMLRVQVRGGKSAGVNLGLSVCRGEVVVILDIDTTLDSDAIAALLPYFAEPMVGGVGGDMGVGNATASLVTRHQEIEYLISNSLGRRIGDLLGTLSIVSGAFGAFRRSAILGVGGQDAEVGEDADLTMKLRRAGWRIRFAPEARALTYVPATMPGLIAQRLRWDRGVVTIWLRKFRGVFDPRPATFRLLDVMAMADVLFFQFLLTLIFPVYIGWLWYHFDSFSLTIMGATLIGYAAMDLLALIVAASLVTDLRRALTLLLYVPVYSVMQMMVMRPVRLIAILQELLLRSSYRDPYVPARVMRQVERV
jgi:cellulose synthase/poly-beta-1,6-N-acetylglucosamine synthase-like glycosyltransferase